MDDPRWLRLITIGLVLAALAVGYFLFTGGLGVSRVSRNISQTNVTPQPSPTTTATPTASPGTQQPQNGGSAYSRILDRNQAEMQTLPRTGFPIGLAIVFSVSAMITGFSLRRFPK